MTQILKNRPMISGTYNDDNIKIILHITDLAENRGQKSSMISRGYAMGSRRQIAKKAKMTNLLILLKNQSHEDAQGKTALVILWPEKQRLSWRILGSFLE